MMPCTMSEYHPSSFDQYVATIVSMSWAFENVVFQGSMEDLSNDIKAGKVTCVADGSFKEQHGTAAWKILNLENSSNFIEG